MSGGHGYSHVDSDRRYYAEGLQGLFSTRVGNNSILDTQIKNLTNRIADFKSVFDKNSNNADDEKLSEADAQENLQEAIESLMTSLQNMFEYYEGL